ncbi:hypothetical protein [Alkaliphilus sp. B6464]|uniref:hypothetical protein n=1 Tax=Alkaliphilus sp. B6464 TaxID=2731219 RepID=UPI001BA4B83C|nr:hypothetical protein [Alkaliphilus sp. B6464]QUH21992.1 hypothetical protein HYG84_18985 [Alkaliphilus sp. B6464]
MVLYLMVSISTLLILIIIYLMTAKSGIYADKIEINVCKNIFKIKISNKEKCSGETAKSPEQQNM